MSSNREYTAIEMVDTFTPNLTPEQRQANIEYFEMVLRLTKDGGYYGWPNLRKTFKVQDGKFHITRTGEV